MSLSKWKKFELHVVNYQDKSTDILLKKLKVIQISSEGYFVFSEVSIHCALITDTHDKVFLVVTKACTIVEVLLALWSNSNETTLYPDDLVSPNCGLPSAQV